MRSCAKVPAGPWPARRRPTWTLRSPGSAGERHDAARLLWPRNPLTGQFPAAYENAPKGNCTAYWGQDHRSHLLAPIIA
jgi:predicted acyl esterase